MNNIDLYCIKSKQRVKYTEAGGPFIHIGECVDSAHLPKTNMLKKYKLVRKLKLQVLIYIGKIIQRFKTKPLWQNTQK